MKRIILLSLVSFLLQATTAHAHGHGSLVLGTVTNVAADSITVKAEDGDIVPVNVGPTTVYQRGSAQAALSDVAVGERVAIDVDAANGSGVAKTVRIGAAPAAGKAASNAGCDQAKARSQGAACGAGNDAPAQDDHVHAH